MDAFCATAPAPLGHLARDRHAARRPAAGSRPADRCARGSARRTSSSATPPARSTRSTARASRSRTRPAGSPPTRSTSRSRPATASRSQTLPATARRGVRPLLQGRSCVRARDRQPGGDARAHPRRDAQPHAHGVGAADHGQPAAPRRARSGRRRRTARSPRSCGSRPSPDAVQRRFRSRSALRVASARAARPGESKSDDRLPADPRDGRAGGRVRAAVVRRVAAARAAAAERGEAGAVRVRASCPSTSRPSASRSSSIWSR